MYVRSQQSGLPCQRRRARRGASVAELVVASVLFIAAASFVVTGAVGLQRVWRDGNRYRLAIDTLNNQLERLTVLNGKELKAASESLEVPAGLSQQLPDAELKCELKEEEFGTRIALSLNWDRQGDLEPVELVGWSLAPEEGN